MPICKREHLGLLLLGLLSGCEKDAIAPEPSKAAPSAQRSGGDGAEARTAKVEAEEVTPAGSASADKPKEKKCAPGGCAPGKCG